MSAILDPSVKCYRQTTFTYSDVSKVFIDSVAEHIGNGESVVLLGPHGIGKKLILSEVHKQLLRRRSGCMVVNLRCEDAAELDEVHFAEFLERELHISPLKYSMSPKYEVLVRETPQSVLHPALLHLRNANSPPCILIAS